MVCECQWGLTTIIMGPIVFICAGVFRILGDPNVLNMNCVAWWFWVNMAFFALGAVMSVHGFAVECCGCCKKDMGRFGNAREPLVDEENQRDEEGREKVPVPYIMITN